MTKSFDWFKYWFDSQYYLILYSHRDEKEAKIFCDLLEKYSQVKCSDEVIDFCCGAGRLTIELAKRGYKTTGIDLSRNLIFQAKEKSKQEKLNIDFIIDDVRKVNFPERFNLAVSFFTSFGYFDDEENYEVFKNICRSVKQNGWVIIDYFNPSFLMNNLVENEIQKINGLAFIQKRTLNENRIVKEIEIISENQVCKFFESVRIYDKNEFVQMFNENGFVIEYLFGDYYGSKFLEHSPRMIFFGKKVN